MATSRTYVPAVSPRLTRLLLVVFAIVALLGANAAYLASITALEWATGRAYQNLFYQYMFLGHLVLGLLVVVPFLAFAALHLRAAFRRRNRRAVRAGYVLLAAGLTLAASGIALVRVGGLELRDPILRAAVYWVHAVAPLATLWLYILHRLAGPRLRWRIGARWAVATALAVAALAAVHVRDPRPWNVVGPREGERYFRPSLARTTRGTFIPAGALMNDAECATCHADTHRRWSASAHRFSSFNNKPYLTSVRETRRVALARDGSVRASRWCAGCHDPVPFFSGAFDRPDFDDERDPTSQAGITCTACHAITNINSTRGNADYTIEEPSQYPFAASRSPLLRSISHQLIKAKPSFHKRTFLKPFHRTPEFCATCHKVHLPGELTGYKEFLRGQNHYDSFLLSGVSGHGARSFYYPDQARPACSGCHMPPMPSGDFGAKPDGPAGVLAVRDHLFPGGNTALPAMRGDGVTMAEQQRFLQTAARVDVFGIRAGGRIDGAQDAPLRPVVPVLQPGRRYLIETVIRTLLVGHHLTQGTADSNEIWLEVRVTNNGRPLAASGAIDPAGTVDPSAFFANVYMLDRAGRRIDRRNAQDIFVPLYDHQIPPGSGQVVYHQLDVPAWASGTIEIAVALQYRKFDATYMRYVLGETHRNDLPVTTMASDRVVVPLAPGGQPVVQPPSPVPEWQRWNDYGIGLLLLGSAGSDKGALRQAAEAFATVERLGRPDGPLNLARVHYKEGSLDQAAAALRRAAAARATPWTLAWLTGLVNKENGHLDAAIENFRMALEAGGPDLRARGFDFSRDYEVINELAQALFERAKLERGAGGAARRTALLREAAAWFERTLALDTENVAAHYGLAQICAQLGEAQRAADHLKLHARYKPDENARDRVVAIHLASHPAAVRAAQSIAIYPLTPAAGAVARVAGPTP